MLSTRMQLVQLLLPVRDNEGTPFPAEWFDDIRHALTERFGGITAYARAPAHGTFAGESGQVISDDIVVFEVMCDALDRGFWAQYRADLTVRFAQEELVIRALPMQRL